MGMIQVRLIVKGFENWKDTRSPLVKLLVSNGEAETQRGPEILKVTPLLSRIWIRSFTHYQLLRHQIFIEQLVSRSRDTEVKKSQNMSLGNSQHFRGARQSLPCNYNIWLWRAGQGLAKDGSMGMSLIAGGGSRVGVSSFRPVEHPVKAQNLTNWL